MSFYAFPDAVTLSIVSGKTSNLKITATIGVLRPFIRN